MVAEYKHGKVDVSGGQIVYRLFAPSGSPNVSLPILLLGGWGSVMNDWFSLPHELARQGHTVLLLDSRGIGESAGDFKSITISDLANDALTVVSSVLGAGKFVAVGHSAGAFVVQHLAIHSPGPIAAAVFIGAQGARATAVAGDAVFFKLGRATFHNGTDLESRMKLLAYFFDTAWRDESSGRDFRQICEQSLHECRPQAVMQAQLKMLGGADFGAELSWIRCPCLVLHGERDNVIPLGNAERLYNDLTGCSSRRLKVISALHVPYGPSVASSREVANEIVSFLSDELQTPSKL